MRVQHPAPILPALRAAAQQGKRAALQDTLLLLLPCLPSLPAGAVPIRHGAAQLPPTESPPQCAAGDGCADPSSPALAARRAAEVRTELLHSPTGHEGQQGGHHALGHWPARVACPALQGSGLLSPGEPGEPEVPLTGEEVAPEAIQGGEHLAIYPSLLLLLTDSK